ncbi:hypothetical protein [Mycobacterium palustre]|uniref:Uncharacterized protein n=1 Tax=Mycobacterium palustre TaxID=153971 RepID=A0A1X1ZP45_9MYCO|nr:hypothetical protein [Mycobacterium palustre]ORW25164.1 hypothetical protein AWC19_08225 [Mycobacterium palustre]
MLYYSNGGPGPATKLLRVDAPGDGDRDKWLFAPAERWNVKTGEWKSDSLAQLDILGTGDFFMVDASQVAGIQRKMKARYEVFTS